MDITFSVLHAFHAGSNPTGNDDVRRVLHDCLVRLNHAHSTNGVGPARYWVNGRCVVWTLPHVFTADSSYDANAYALRCLLDCLIDLNLSYLKYGGKRRIPKLYDSPVYYERTVIWDTIPGLYRRGYGDCKSLTAALIAQYRTEGKECAPVFRFQRRPDGSESLDFHILVQTANGFEDPSKIKGMGTNENAPIRGLGKRRT
jgi:hypothetical protein